MLTRALLRLFAKKKLESGVKNKNYPNFAPKTEFYPPSPNPNFSYSDLIHHPNTLYLTQGRAMEEPFTGRLWNKVDVGYYNCAICNSRLFTFNHKFSCNSGMASFWTCCTNALQFQNKVEDIQRAVGGTSRIKQEQPTAAASCKYCKAHHGLVYRDGPPPTHLRLSINSGGLVFEPLPLFENPMIKKSQKLKAEKRKVLGVVPFQQMPVPPKAGQGQ